MKNKQRSKVTKAKVHARGTGGGPPLPDPKPNELEAELLNIMGEESFNPVTENNPIFTDFVSTLLKNIGIMMSIMICACIGV